MLSKLENERLCRIGPGTAMGDVFRRYWNPVCLVEQLPPPDGKPLRVQALGFAFGQTLSPRCVAGASPCLSDPRMWTCLHSTPAHGTRSVRKAPAWPLATTRLRC
jgi:hypothetical protein